MKDKLTETLLASQTLFNGKILRLKVDRVRLPDGREATREMVEHPGAVAVVPVTAKGDVILVRQYRHPIGTITWEIPAGKLDPGETPEICARRELEEETGFYVTHLEKIASFYTAPGFTNEIIHLFCARNLKATRPHTDADEFIETAVVPLAEARAMIARGEICDAKSIIGILMCGANTHG